MGEESGGSIGTTLAESCELCDAIRQWNTIQNLREGLPTPVSVQTHHHHIATLAIHKITDELHETREELSFLNDDKLVRNIHRQLLEHLVGVPHHARDLELIMRDDTGIAGLSLVNVGLDDEYRKIQRLITANQMVDLGRLSREHGTEDDFERHLQSTYVSCVSKMDYTFAGVALAGIGFCVFGTLCGFTLREIIHSCREPVSPLPRYMPLRAVPVPIGPQVEMACVPMPNVPLLREDSNDPLKSELPIQV